MMIIRTVRVAPVWRVEFWAGDEYWKPSLHIHFPFFRRYYWLLIWLPEWRILDKPGSNQTISRRSTVLSREKE